MDKNINNFHFLVGQTIMHCQTIELDIKYIYSAMLKGDFDDNYSKVEELTLGQVINKLKKLDYSDNDHFFNEKDYELLEEITEKRNHIVHKTYQYFVYDRGSEYQKSFNCEFEDLETFNKSISKLSETVENVRFKAYEKYGRKFF